MRSAVEGEGKRVRERARPKLSSRATASAGRQGSNGAWKAALGRAPAL